MFSSAIQHVEPKEEKVSLSAELDIKFKKLGLDDKGVERLRSAYGADRSWEDIYETFCKLTEWAFHKIAEVESLLTRLGFTDFSGANCKDVNKADYLYTGMYLIIRDGIAPTEIPAMLKDKSKSYLSYMATGLPESIWSTYDEALKHYIEYPPFLLFPLPVKLYMAASPNFTGSIVNRRWELEDLINEAKAVTSGKPAPVETQSTSIVPFRGAREVDAGSDGERKKNDIFNEILSLTQRQPERQRAADASAFDASSPAFFNARNSQRSMDAEGDALFMRMSVMQAHLEFGDCSISVMQVRMMVGSISRVEHDSGLRMSNYFR